MINFKDYNDLSDSDIIEINEYVERMYDFIPLESAYSFTVTKKYIRKILEIIEKGEKDEI